MIARAVVILFGVLLLHTAAYAQADKAKAQKYVDSRGKSIEFPLGDISFADEVVSFEKGTPAAAGKEGRADAVLGLPDYKHRGQNPSAFVSLGCAGTLIVRFTNNALVDRPGFDLYVFEVGPAIEPTSLAISKDGESWIEIGEISGGTAQVDIAAHIKPGDVFHVVRLTDLRSDCSGVTPGADIDAVAAIGSAIQISLNAAVLFDFNEYALKEEAKAALHSVAATIKQHPDSEIMIEGHTDNVGSSDYNQKLSEDRAAAVRAYLVSRQGFTSDRIHVHGYGKARPIASNETDEGRGRNRRVEIIIIPGEARRRPAF